MMKSNDGKTSLDLDTGELFINGIESKDYKESAELTQETLVTKYGTAKEVNTNAEDFLVFEEAGSKVILDYFEYSQNNKDAYPVLHINGANPNNSYQDQIFHTVAPHGTRWHATPLRLASDGHPNLEVMAYDSDVDQYKFNLKKPIELPGGARLAFKNTNEDDTVIYKAVYRVIG